MHDGCTDPCVYFHYNVLKELYDFHESQERSSDIRERVNILRHQKIFQMSLPRRISKDKNKIIV
jgi:hypothetical protein